MTENYIMATIGEAAIERKQCLDKMSCREARLKKALYGLNHLLDETRNPLNEENQSFLAHSTDPRDDAKMYVEAAKRADELSAFLRKHNAL